MNCFERLYYFFKRITTKRLEGHPAPFNRYYHPKYPTNKP